MPGAPPEPDVTRPGVGAGCDGPTMTSPPAPRFWIAAACLDEVERDRADGVLRAGGGRETRLTRLHRGDGHVRYSARVASGGRVLQQVTALGLVVDDNPFRDSQERWCRRVDHEQVAAVPVRPLLPLLGFVTDEQRWGLPFRAGLLELTAGDFGVLAGALRDAYDVPLEYSASGRSARA